MKNMYIRVVHLTGRYWSYDSAWVTQNADGSWHIAKWNDSRESHVDCDASAVQYMIATMHGLYEASRLKSMARFEIKEITADNAEDFKADLMRGYDKHPEFIESYVQQAEAEEKNRSILAQIERIDNALKVAEVAA